MGNFVRAWIRMRASARIAGLTDREFIALEIVKNDGPTPIRSLIHHLHMAPSEISRMLTKLESRGLVIREIDFLSVDRLHFETKRRCHVLRCLSFVFISPDGKRNYDCGDCHEAEPDSLHEFSLRIRATAYGSVRRGLAASVRVGFQGWRIEACPHPPPALPGGDVAPL